MTKDMTEGSPLRLIWQFSLPLILGNLLQQLYNLVDTVIVGRAIGLTALTAVGGTTSISTLIIGFTIGTCSGMAIPVAVNFGAKEYSKMRQYIMNAAYLGLALAVLLTVATTLLCGRILHWMQTPEDVYPFSYSYFFIICLGIPFTILYNATAAIIRALGDSKTPFYFLLISTVLNVCLDLFFIIVLHSGVAGAAWATILSQGVSGILCFIYMKKKHTVSRSARFGEACVCECPDGYTVSCSARFKEASVRECQGGYEILRFEEGERQLRMEYIRNLLVNAIPMGLQTSITAIGMVMLQSAVNGLEAVYVSAFAGALKIKQLAMTPYEAVSTACATFGSQNLGAGKIDRIKRGLVSGITICFIYSIVMGVILVTNGANIACLFIDSNETEVLAQLQRFLTCTGCFYWLLAILNCTRMTIQGLGYSGIAVFAGFSELLARGLSSLFVIPVVGFTAVCFTEQVAWLAAVCVVVPVFLVIIRKVEKRRL